jgi:hypothetical protein
VNPFEPKSVLLWWSQPTYGGGAGPFVPYFGLPALGSVLGATTNNDARNGRYRVPFDLLVRELSIFSAFAPPDVSAETWTLIDGVTAIGTVTRPGGSAFNTVVARVNRLVRKNAILTASIAVAAPIVGGYQTVMTAACEQVSL